MELIQGTRVDYDVQTLKGKGTIVGIASRMPGTIVYIIEPDKAQNIPNETYPYSHFVCPDGQLMIIDEKLSKEPEDRKDSVHDYSNRID